MSTIARRHSQEGQEEWNVIALAKDGGERFIFLFDDAIESKEALLNNFRQLAADPTIHFTWYDVVVLSQKCHSLLGNN